jgi:hypothetical protein
MAKHCSAAFNSGLTVIRVSVSDPGYGSGFSQVRNPYPDPGGEKWPKKGEKI